MPFCPSCGYQYREGTQVWPECAEVLMSSEPLTCEFCSGGLSEGEKFCHRCGMLQAGMIDEEEEIECENHPGMEAVGACIVCGKPVCGDCAVKRQGKILCENEEHVTIANKWAVLCATGTEYEAQMIRANLEGADIPCRVFSRRDHVYFLTVGEKAVVHVVVPRERLPEAREFLRKMDLFEEGNLDEQ